MRPTRLSGRTRTPRRRSHRSCPPHHADQGEKQHCRGGKNIVGAEHKRLLFNQPIDHAQALFVRQVERAELRQEGAGRGVGGVDRLDQLGMVQAGAVIEQGGGD